MLYDLAQATDGLELVVGAVLRLTPSGTLTQFYLPAGHASVQPNR